MSEAQIMTMPQPSKQDRESVLTRLKRLMDLMLQRGDAETETLARVAILLQREAQAERVRRNRVNRVRRKRRKLLGTVPKASNRRPAVNLRDLLSRSIQ